MEVFTAVEPKVMPFHGGGGSSGDVIDMGPRGAEVSLLFKGARLYHSRGPGSEYPEAGNLNIQKASPGQPKPKAKTIEAGVLQTLLPCAHPPFLVVQGARSQLFSMVFRIQSR